MNRLNLLKNSSTKVLTYFRNPLPRIVLHNSLARPLLTLALIIAPASLLAQDTAQVRDSMEARTAKRSGSDSARTLVKILVRATPSTAGYTARRTFSATRTDLPLRDVPQSVTVIGRQLIDDQAAQSMGDVVRYIPGITMGQGEGHRDAPTIRGNSSTADFFINGVRDDVQYFRDLYNVDRVEALKGSNAMIFGRGGAGGVINRVTKQADWGTYRSVMYESGSNQHNRGTVDFGGALGNALAGRVTGLLEKSGDFRESTELSRSGINPTVAVMAGGTMFRVGYEHFADRRTVNRGMPSFRGAPSAADINTFFGDPDRSRARAIVNSGEATIERGSPDRVMIRNRSLIASYDKYYQNVYPGALNAEGTHVAIQAYGNQTDRRNLFNQTDVTFALGSGNVRHLTLVGAELGRQITDNFRRTGYFAGDATSFSAPFSDPTISEPVTFRQSASDADNRTTAGVSAAYAQHQLAIGTAWHAIAGLRYERFELDYHNNRNGQSLFRADKMLSPRVGLVFKPSMPVSIYGSHSVSFLPASGDQFASLSATTTTLAPERFTNREVGVKWDVTSALALTGALYRLDRTNAAAPDPLNPSLRVQTGSQRTTGAEAGIAGSVNSRWDIAGGYAWQRAKIVSRTAEASAGAMIPLVPAYTASLWNRYRVTPRVSAGLGLIRQAEMYAAIDNTVLLPAFTRVDAAVFFSPFERLRAQVNIENLLDATYYPTSHGNNNIQPGAPRTLRVSLTATP